MQRHPRPTYAAVSNYIASLVPLKDNDISRLYHAPRASWYDPNTVEVEQIVLSITPTPGVYDLIGHPSEKATSKSTQPGRTTCLRLPRTICFLHRPFNLDRNNVHGSTLVITSHTSFDEVLTIGWNPVLAERFGLELRETLCIQGYKGDLERKIGIIGSVAMLKAQLLEHVRKEFGEIGHVMEGLCEEIHVVAIMNTFNAHEVHRVLDTVRAHGWISGEDDGRHLLYITGQPRITGLEAAKALGMSVACVGHHQAEAWGIRYIAARLRSRYADLRVEEVYEEETTMVRD